MVSKWELLSEVHSSTYRTKILKLLGEGFKTPTKLMNDSKIKLSHVSRALRQLEELKLIKCLTPQARKSKMFKITELGKEILKLLSK